MTMGFLKIQCVLSRWSRITHRFLDHYPSPGRTLYKSITRDFGGLVTNSLRLFRWLALGGGGVWSPPWGWTVGWAPGKKRSTVIFHLITISSSWWASAASSSVCWAGASYSSIGMWTLQLWDIRSANSSLIEAWSSVVVYLRPRSRASPTVKEGGRKLVCRMSM